MARKVIIPSILDYMRQYSDSALSAADIARPLHLTEQQVRHALANLIAGRTTLGASAKHIEVVIRGNVWIWHSDPSVKLVQPIQIKQDTSTLYEEIGRSRTGTIIVEGEDGTLYKVMEI